MKVLLFICTLSIAVLCSVAYECGVADSPARYKRVIGGTDVKEYKWPWIVNVWENITKTWDGDWLYNMTMESCTGAIVPVSSELDQSDIVITAAHCINTETEVRVRAGAFNDYKMQEQHIPLYNQRMHPNYICRRLPENKYNWREKCATQLDDIAIIKLTKPIKFSEKVKPICLPTHNSFRDDMTCKFAGWGITDNGNSPKYLQEISMQKKACPWIPKYIKNSKQSAICTEPSDKNTCDGDSGGPLMCSKTISSPFREQWTAVGFLSAHFGPKINFKECTARSQYTSAEFYLDWIQKTICEMSELGHGSKACKAYHKNNPQ